MINMGCSNLKQIVASFLLYYAGYNRGGHANITITYNKYIHSIQEEVRNGK